MSPQNLYPSVLVLGRLIMILLHLVICLVLSSSLYAQNLAIDDASPSWSYSPPVCQDFCDGTQSGIQQSWYLQTFCILNHSYPQCYQVAACKSKELFCNARLLRSDRNCD